MKTIDSNNNTVVEYGAACRDLIGDALGRRIEKKDHIDSSNTRRNHRSDAATESSDSITQKAIPQFFTFNFSLFISAGHLFSPVALVNFAGTVLERYEYDAYGRPVRIRRIMGDTTILHFSFCILHWPLYLFTGRRVDILDNANLKLQYNRNRYYDYHTGRWLTQDPAGYVDSYNLYLYARNNPMLLADPDGLFTLGALPGVGRVGRFIINRVNRAAMSGLMWAFDKLKSKAMSMVCEEDRSLTMPIFGLPMAGTECRCTLAYKWLGCVKSKCSIPGNQPWQRSLNLEPQPFDRQTILNQGKMSITGVADNGQIAMNTYFRVSFKPQSGRFGRYDKEMNLLAGVTGTIRQRIWVQPCCSCAELETGCQCDVGVRARLTRLGAAAVVGAAVLYGPYAVPAIMGLGSSLPPMIPALKNVYKVISPN